MITDLGERTRTILVVDDDEAVCSFLEGYLSENGFRVLTQPDGNGLSRTIREQAVELVLLDLVLPEDDGIALARALRSWSDVPIIILTGRGEEVDRVVGLEVGADDYVAKPFGARELLARIKSVLRRSVGRNQAGGAAFAPKRHACFVGWRLDFPSRKLISTEGRIVRLTPRQFDLLSTFVTHPNTVLGRDRLLDLLGADSDSSFDRSIDVQVMRLRRKIETDPKRPELITTVRTGGYLFTPNVEWL